jgi:hypothetical protein
LIGGPVRGANPQTRLGYLARMLIERKLVIDSGGTYPLSPDIADFTEAFRLQMEWELNNAQIEEHSFFDRQNRLEHLKQRKSQIEKEMMNSP